MRKMLYKQSLRFYKAFFFLTIIFHQNPVLGQKEEFIVCSEESGTGIGFVNIGVPARNIGTVTDGSGKFTLGFGTILDEDSLRFSMIGYETRTLSASQVRKAPSGTIYLKPKTYSLPGLNIVYPRGKEIMLGYPVFSNALRSGFASNDLGSELGIRVIAKKRMKLRDIHLNIGVCTYDSVTYRLNIYRRQDDAWENILTRPVYVSFTKEDIGEPVTVDLAAFSIILEGETIVSLELYKNLGEGKLLFLTQFFTGTTYHRTTKESEWTQAPGQIGMYLHGQALR